MFNNRTSTIAERKTNKSSLLFLFIILYTLLSCQTKQLQKAIIASTSRINSISSIYDTFPKPLLKSIENSRVVMLGEQAHGDATTFEVKTKIIQYLHDHLDFDVILFESDFFALSEQWDRVKVAEDVTIMMEENIFSTWTKCNQFSQLKDYLAKCYKEGKAVEIGGIDIQFYGEYSQKHFKKWFIDLLNQYKSNDGGEIQMSSDFLYMLDSVVYHSKMQSAVKDTTSLQYFQNELNEIILEIKNKNILSSYELQVIKNLQFQVSLMLYRSKPNLMKAAQLRDKQMADNLHWLLTNKFKGKKVIVWAASSHIYTAPIEPVKNISQERFFPMGYYLKNLDSSIPVYTLGFTSYEGSSRRVNMKPYYFTSSNRNSLEEWIKTKDMDFAYIDLEKASSLISKKQPFYMAGAAHIQTKQYWMEGFDGIIYIGKMDPCSFKEN